MVTIPGGRAGRLLVGAGAALAARGVVRGLRRADLDGQVALVTGASRGLGFLLARELAGQGCRLVVCARDGAALARAAEELRRGGAEVEAVTCDVAAREQVEGMVGQAEERFGPVGVLVNNAGVIQVGPVATMRVEDFEQALGVMLWGTVYPTLAVLPRMLERRAGRIVNITSIGGSLSAPHLLPYCTAKFAAVGFSEGLRAELAGSGVHVTTVIPGLMRTGSHVNAQFKGQHRREFTWFALGASLPLVSVDAERAAARIVDAARRGKAELILTPQAQLAARGRGVLPGLAVRTLSVVNRALPSADGDRRDTRRGMEVAPDSAWFDRATRLGLDAARRFHQLPVSQLPPD